MMNGDNDSAIIIKGARVHNLKNISISIPRDQLIVITGPSGSGKSSLAFDTIFAEGQRRYVESLSAYARQFLEQLNKPEIESISGLSPAIAIEQRSTSNNPRSTVGTITEIHDYLRLLYSRIAKPFCYSCGNPIQSQSPQQIVDQVLSMPEESKISLLAPIIQGRKGEHQKELLQLRQKGFVRVRIDGEILDLSQNISLDKNKKHNIEVFIDRLIIKGDRSALGTRVSESVELALKNGEGQLLIRNELNATETLFSEKFACTACGISYSSPEPKMFSFNSPAGACGKCDGIGHLDPSEEEDEDDTPSDLPTGINELKAHKTCPDCKGTRLKKESLHFKINNKNIAELCGASISSLQVITHGLALSEREKKIASPILKEISDRLIFLTNVGVGYLSLDRSSNTLSGGEAQRIRLATQIGSSLVGVIYILDEPSIGLHSCDNQKLISTLIHLKKLGNTVIVVEHDQDTMLSADFIVDMGPGAGRLGGEITAQGSPSDIKKNKNSITGKYLSGKLSIPLPEKRRPFEKEKAIQIRGAQLNNLKNINVDFPLGLLTCVTGVSGSGKSTLVIDTLYRVLLKSVYKIDTGSAHIDSVRHLDQIDKVIDIDQSPIGRTPRSNPATYTGTFTAIREIFAMLPEAQTRGFGIGRFSFNAKAGRCEACEGDGNKKIEMHFLPNVKVTCDVCGGKRYNRETLEVKYKNKSIADVLDMTVDEALDFFESIPSLKTKLKILNEVGLGYIRLGQAATTLSGGEAQRIKLSKELAKRSTGKTLYILDEPSTGLHFDDVKKLIQILQSLVDQGNTVVVIEHNLDIIKSADYLIDIGPDGGQAGGQVIASGTPEEICKNFDTATAKALRPML